jgi:hypothetical protein
MRINELLVESQQLDEGPFTQAIGKVGGKIAKGVANIGKDLKTGFKAGYSGEQPPADAAAAPTQAAPVKKAGGGFIDQFKKGFAQGRGEPAATAAPAAEPAPAATTNTAPPAAATAAEPAPAAPAAEPAPVANPKADAQSKVGVGQINKIIPTLRTRDLMSLKKNLDAVIATKQKTPAEPAAQPADASTAAAPVDQAAPSATPPETTAKKGRKKKAVAPTQAEIDADRERNIGMASDSVIRTGASLSETLARKVQEQKQRIFETALMSGTQSVFKK